MFFFNELTVELTTDSSYLGQGAAMEAIKECCQGKWTRFSPVREKEVDQEDLLKEVDSSYSGIK